MSKEYKTFYGSRSNNSCAYCWKHCLSLTPKQVKTRGCLGKQCDALKKFDHPFWDAREAKKEQRRARKARLEDRYKEATNGSSKKETNPSEDGSI